MEVERNHYPAYFEGMKNEQTLTCVIMTHDEYLMLCAIIATALKHDFVPFEIIKTAKNFVTSTP